MEDCLFCKIIKGKISSSKIYEDDKVLAFLDIAPVNLGHALIISKEHSKDLFDTSDSTLGDFFPKVKKVAAAVKKATNADGINLEMNNGKAAGQIIFHAHMHIMPRFSGDGLKPWPQKQYNEGEMEMTAESIRKAL